MLENLIKENKEKMEKVIEKSHIEINKITPNLANANILSDINVEYYGSYMSILQLAKVNVVEGKQFFIKPYDLKLIPNISAAITKKNIGLVPQQNADSVIIKIPALTEEKRKECVKKLHATIESHKVSVRNIRRNVNQLIKKDTTISKNEQKTLEDRIQKLTDEKIKLLNDLSIKKEKEILTV